jgi:5-methylcytosine-specific restriction endonuclease McrA
MKERNGPIVDLFNEQAGFCCYCSKKMTLKKGGRDMATVEHIIPKSRGGEDKPSNWAAAHGICNWERGNRPLLLHLAILKYGKIKGMDLIR